MNGLRSMRGKRCWLFSAVNPRFLRTWGVIFFLAMLAWGSIGPAPCLGFSGGDIQITCEPGARIWVGDVFKGKTSAEENGMFIEGLRPGRYKIKAIKSGYKPVEKMVSVQGGTTIEVRFSFTSPAMKVEDLTGTDERQAIHGIGNLILRSAPLHAAIYLDGKKIGKTDTRISNIPAGNHSIRFVFKGKALEGRYYLAPNQTLKLKAHFKKGKIVKEHESVFSNSFGMKFVYVTPGTLMDRDKAIPIGEFYIQATEVTQGQWKRVMGRNPAGNRKCGEDCPVETVAPIDVRDFIRSLNQLEGTDRYRLPTQAEWEYACHAGRTSRFCFGENEKHVGDYAWYVDNSRGRTHPVGKKKPNAWGIYDMHGNVSEWCQDLYGGTDPVCRGGSYMEEPAFLSCFIKKVISGSSGNPSIGLRVIRLP